MSTVRTSVIENFLTAIASDETVPPDVAREMRELLTPAATSDGELPNTDRIATVVRTHAAAEQSTGRTA